MAEVHTTRRTNNGKYHNFSVELYHRLVLAYIYNDGLIYSKIILHVDKTYPGTFSQQICHEPNIQHMARRDQGQMSNSYFACLFRIPHQIRKPWLHQSHPCRSPTLDLWVNIGDLQLLLYDQTKIHQQILKCKKPVT